MWLIVKLTLMQHSRYIYLSPNVVEYIMSRKPLLIFKIGGIFINQATTNLHETVNASKNTCFDILIVKANEHFSKMYP